MKRIINALGQLNWGKRAYAVFVLCATTAIALPAQTFTTLYSFDGTRRPTPRGGAGPGHQWGLLRDNVSWRGQRRMGRSSKSPRAAR